jgi:hypothetical protein
MILSVNGNTDKKAIREFVDNYLLARDSRALREYIRTIQPDVELKFNFNGPDGLEEGVNIPIGVNFLYPDLGI